MPSSTLDLSTALALDSSPINPILSNSQQSPPVYPSYAFNDIPVHCSMQGYGYSVVPPLDYSNTYFPSHFQSNVLQTQNALGNTRFLATENPRITANCEVAATEKKISEFILPANVQSPPIAGNDFCYFSLKKWTPISIERDGSCQVCGYTTDHERYIYSGKIQFVDERNNVISDGKQFIKLCGPLCFDAFKLMCPQLEIAALPERISSLFISGFPRKGWRRAMKHLYRFISRHLESPQGGASNVSYAASFISCSHPIYVIVFSNESNQIILCVFRCDGGRFMVHHYTVATNASNTLLEDLLNPMV